MLPILTEKGCRVNSHNEVASAAMSLYASGNPQVYNPVPAESVYTELDRENSRLFADRARLRHELIETRADLKTARSRAWWLGVVVGLYTVGTLVVVGILLLR